MIEILKNITFVQLRIQIKERERDLERGFLVFVFFVFLPRAGVAGRKCKHRAVSRLNLARLITLALEVPFLQLREYLSSESNTTPDADVHRRTTRISVMHWFYIAAKQKCASRTPVQRDTAAM